MIAVEQFPQTAPPASLEPPPPPPVPQKTVGTGIPRVPPPPDTPSIGFAHGFLQCYLLPIALNLFMSTIIALVSDNLVPFWVALAGLLIPAVGYYVERRAPAGTPRRFKIAHAVLLLELAFFGAWELGMYLWWPRGG